MTYSSAMPNLYAEDIDRTFAFYRDQLGGRETFRFPVDGSLRHVEFMIGDAKIALSCRDEVEPQGMPVPSAGHPYELSVWCDDTDEAVESLRTAGTPILREPFTHVAGIRRAYVADPDGTWIALVSSSKDM